MQLKTVAVPPPAPTQIRIRVHAAGVNPIDWKRTISQEFYTNCVTAGSSIPKNEKHLEHMHHRPPSRAFPCVIGVDGAGVIESVGSSVTDLQVGDRVMFHTDITSNVGGSFCEYVLLKACVAVRIPEGKDHSLIPYEIAAAIPCATWTAYIALFDKLRIEGWRTIFIDGASGGVGSVAVQLAHHFGLFVFASCSAGSVAYVKELGADVVFDYVEPDRMLDAILDHTKGVGVDYYLAVSPVSDVERNADVLRFGGSLCLLSGVLAPRTDLLFRLQLSMHHVHLGGLYDHPATIPQLRSVGERCMGLLIEGTFGVRTEVLPFSEGATALDRLAKGTGTKGKLVLKIQ